MSERGPGSGIEYASSSCDNSPQQTFMLDDSEIISRSATIAGMVFIKRLSLILKSREGDERG